MSPLHISGCQTDCLHPEDYTPPPPVTSRVCFTTDQVRRQLMKLHSNKAPGPHGISPRVLNACTPQLCVLHHVFDMSLSLQRVHMLWKTSCPVPVPKTPQPTVSKKYRPVALTFHPGETCPRAALAQGQAMDPSSSPIIPDLELRTPSSTCSTVSTPTWTSQRVRLCFLTSRVHLTPFVQLDWMTN